LQTTPNVRGSKRSVTAPRVLARNKTEEMKPTGGGKTNWKGADGLLGFATMLPSQRKAGPNGTGKHLRSKNRHRRKAAGDAYHRRVAKSSHMAQKGHQKCLAQGHSEEGGIKPQKGSEKFVARSRSFGEIAEKGRKTFFVLFVGSKIGPFLRGVYSSMGFRAERLSARVSVLGRF